MFSTWAGITIIRTPDLGLAVLAAAAQSYCVPSGRVRWPLAQSLWTMDGLLPTRKANSRRQCPPSSKEPQDGSLRLLGSQQKAAVGSRTHCPLWAASPCKSAPRPEHFCLCHVLIVCYQGAGGNRSRMTLLTHIDVPSAWKIQQKALLLSGPPPSE